MTISVKYHHKAHTTSVGEQSSPVPERWFVVRGGSSRGDSSKLWATRLYAAEALMVWI
ncbi:MAG: hypothetical protein JEZ07_18340 [Phycisphaerae bacterium]|nr:hypothetical protein [Phycisphaerae bacterium]